MCSKQHKLPYHQLYRYLLDALRQYPQPYDLQQKVFTSKFVCWIYNQEPYFLCDGIICMQIDFHSKSSLPNTTSPVNKTRTKYYTPYKQAAKTFNCPDIMLQHQPTKYCTPYEPFFHFRERYGEFKKQRLKQWPKRYGEILIEQWVIKIVNIANTGYYAPVIDALKFKISKDKIQIPECKPTSILYLPEVVQYFLDFHSLKIKQHLNRNQKQYRSQELCYFIRNKTKKNNIEVNFVSVDLQGKIFQIDKKQESKLPNQLQYVLVSDKPITGTVSLKKRLPPFTQMGTQSKQKALSARHTTLNRFFFQEDQKEESQDTDDLLNESDSEYSRREESEMKFDNESQDSQQDNPLRQLYRRMIRNQKFIQNARMEEQI